MKRNITVVYALLRENEECFYVGITNDIRTRLRNHRHKGYVRGFYPKHKILESGLTRKRAHLREVFWINHFRSLGLSLWNKRPKSQIA